jgi:hypothetical protein
MIELIFVIALTAALFGLMGWGFKVLPGERWQMLATVPLWKDAAGNWRGLNLTWYGLLTATAYTLAVAVVFILLGAVHVEPGAVFLLTLSVLAVCAPASSLVARFVEKKKHTFSVAAGFFVGVLVVPPVIVGINALFGYDIAYMPALAATSIAYAFGEGIGRLACISFGCCYGKPLAQLPAWAQKMFAHWHFTFCGSTKKIAYAGGMDGVKVLPIQGITAVLYTSIGLLGVVLFLNRDYAVAFVLTMVATQSWRVYSETLRADHRGGGKISAYQWMALATSIYAVVLATAFDAAVAPAADLRAGMHAIWQPGVLLSLQALWCVIFVYTGRSAVTEATVSFRVCRDKI